MKPRELTERAGQKVKLTPRRTFLLWPMRLVVLVGGFTLCWLVLYPLLPTYPGLVVGGLVAAGLVVAETWLTAKIRRGTLGEVAARRLFIADHFLAGEQSLSRRPAQPGAGLGAQSEPDTFGALPAAEVEPDEPPRFDDVVEADAVEVDEHGRPV